MINKVIWKCQQVWEKTHKSFSTKHTLGGGWGGMQAVCRAILKTLLQSWDWSHSNISAGSQRVDGGQRRWAGLGFFSLKRQQTTGQGGFNVPFGQRRHILFGRLALISPFSHLTLTCPPTTATSDWQSHEINDFYLIVRLKPFLFFSAASKKLTLYAHTCFFSLLFARDDAPLIRH